MKKRVFVVLFIIICMTTCCSCGGNKANTSEETNKKQEETAEKTDTTPETDPNGNKETAGNEETDEIIKKITVAADDTGIYSVTITLSSKAADKGTVEMVYNGPKGSPQENSVVCTYKIEYEKNNDGTFEIKTFYNGDVDRNLHNKEQVKVENTFGAAVRGGDITITYTPDGGESREIYNADASQFQ